ncbi:GNAT family N-acetyltransferase [Geodermatophilus sp. YIM 151500]|uniref:GNAT family N-acetyltransferase n=1 Tax=Geodermatophilus sp. YIM 151500 TaxID=2984531 RepID=UPI0021E41D54|nr:GNAT family N-acetyltransferase [Geodermatophilus sp. YIM 151500]MCV2488161.1 GNAT family N-acetyltransferase [Geodermatophilus sp. YIM 151500]
MHTTIRRLEEADVAPVVRLSLTAWEPVFASFEAQLGPTVYRMLFPDWRSAQARAVETTCRAPDHDVWVADADGRPVGFVAVTEIEEDAARAGEIVMTAVDPAVQGAGVGTALLDHAVGEISARGLRLAVVATGGDPGHAPARALYERRGFRPLPLVRYYRPL